MGVKKGQILQILIFDDLKKQSILTIIIKLYHEHFSEILTLSAIRNYWLSDLRSELPRWHHKAKSVELKKSLSEGHLLICAIYLLAVICHDKCRSLIWISCCTSIGQHLLRYQRCKNSLSTHVVGKKLLFFKFNSTRCLTSK